MRSIYLKPFRALRLFILIGMVGTLIHFPLSAQDLPVFSLQDCIDYALGNNVTLKNSELEKHIADTDIKQTAAQGYPQVNAESSLASNPIIPRFFVPATTFDPNASPDEVNALQFSPEFQGDAIISAQQMIFDPSYFVALKASKTYKELSTKEHIKNEIDIIEAVTKAYYLILVDEERLELLEKEYERLDTLFNETSIMYENGFAEKIDVSRIKVQVNNTKVELRKVRELLDVNYKLLKFQMGMRLDNEILLADRISEIRFEAGDYESDIRAFTYDQRIEYSQLQTNKELAELSIRNERSGYSPRLSAFGSFGASMGAQEFDDMWNFTGDNSTWFALATVGIRLNVPIFDGFLRANKIQKGKLELMQIENRFYELESNIQLELERSMINLNVQRDNLEAQRENLELAQEVYQVTKEKYQEGFGSNLEVIDASSSFKQAEVNYYTALYDALIAKIELEKTLGLLHKGN